MRGRRPNSDNVVPMTANTDAARFEEMARAKADELKPARLRKEVAAIWDRLAPRAAHPLINRLREEMVEGFVLLCEALADYERYGRRLRSLGETYTVETRNGKQHKNRPEVAQRNEAFRRALTMLRDFGLTPAAERAVQNTAAQGNLFDEDDADFA